MNNDDLDLRERFPVFQKPTKYEELQDAIKILYNFMVQYKRKHSEAKIENIKIVDLIDHITKEGAKELDKMEKEDKRR